MFAPLLRIIQEQDLVINPDFYLVGSMPRFFGFFGTERTWVEIQDGKLTGIEEVGNGFGGLACVDSYIPKTYFPGRFGSEKELHAYFTERGAPEETYQQIVVPSISDMFQDD